MFNVILFLAKIRKLWLGKSLSDSLHLFAQKFVWAWADIMPLSEKDSEYA